MNNIEINGQPLLLNKPNLGDLTQHLFLLMNPWTHRAEFCCITCSLMSPVGWMIEAK
jgi:hypothetical protein